MPILSYDYTITAHKFDAGHSSVYTLTIADRINMACPHCYRTVQEAVREVDPEFRPWHGLAAKMCVVRVFGVRVL